MAEALAAILIAALACLLLTGMLRGAAGIDSSVRAREETRLRDVSRAQSGDGPGEAGEVEIEWATDPKRVRVNYHGGGDAWSYDAAGG